MVQQRQKVRVSRNRILDSAVKVMELYCAHKAVLEVEYFGEVGTGLGPTLEFYTLVSHELQKRSLGLWREEGAAGPAAGELVAAPSGLFPAPAPPSDSAEAVEKKCERFRLLGRVMAKALQDGRLLDMSLAVPFYKLMLGKPLGLFDVRGLDSMLGATMEEMDALCRQKRALEAADAPRKQVCNIRTQGGENKAGVCFWPYHDELVGHTGGGVESAWLRGGRAWAQLHVARIPRVRALRGWHRRRSHYLEPGAVCRGGGGGHRGRGRAPADGRFQGWLPAGAPPLCPTVAKHLWGECDFSFGLWV